ncbi:hypothetical protein Dsin_014541 [Dipteronia sinensis]|uniref:Uncharacterized protein n=1 Tax=Dipteronia sinensis TaxID=43782 RepID=A0AAE0ALY7_9ROSI|nr:hypothetical protein Dsin_014541 [Dipteronia sinensis]
MEYLKPLNFYEEIFMDILIKRDYLKPGRLLGLDVSEVCVVGRVRLEEQNCCAFKISEHNLVGFVVALNMVDLWCTAYHHKDIGDLA